MLECSVLSNNSLHPKYRLWLWPYEEAWCECVSFRASGGACKHLRAAWTKVCARTIESITFRNIHEFLLIYYIYVYLFMNNSKLYAFALQVNELFAVGQLPLPASGLEPNTFPLTPPSRAHAIEQRIALIAELHRQRSTILALPPSEQPVPVPLVVRDLEELVEELRDDPYDELLADTEASEWQSEGGKIRFDCIIL